MGTSCSLRWREADEKERLWVVEGGHPISAGLPDFIEIPECEMYGEFFDVPAPDALVFISWFQGGEVFRSGCCYRRGHGKVFYFRPGHETYPIYFMPEVRRILANAVAWSAPSSGPDYLYSQGAINFREPLEPLPEGDSSRKRVG
jgi:trehalose utilization protein